MKHSKQWIHEHKLDEICDEVNFLQHQINELELKDDLDMYEKCCLRQLYAKLKRVNHRWVVEANKKI